MLRTAAAAVLLAILCVALSGCGGGSDTTTTTTTTTEPNGTSTTEATTTTSARVPEATTTTSSATQGLNCLCIFDIDRTLTAKQGAATKCPGAKEVEGVKDTAYGGGTLMLSELAQSVALSACAKCHLGTISAGSASGAGSKEREVLHRQLAAVQGKLPTDQWSGIKPVVSPLVTECPDETKQDAVPGILDWYSKHGFTIHPSDVYFFDDRVNNVKAFQGHPYNAKQVACAARDYDGTVGLCGATLQEIQLEKGIHTCKQVYVV